jgi:putative ABC transport system permease protein
MQALPVTTKLLNLSVVEGQWLSKRDANDVVLNQLARELSSNIKIGDHVFLLLDGKPVEWNVIGFTNDVGTHATAYVSLDAFAKRLNRPGEIKTLRIAYTDRSKDNSLQKNREIENLLEREGIPVNTAIPVWLLQSAIAGHMKVLVNALLAMAVLMAIVGILGLMSTMSMNVMERTREIGVMRAIGATPRKIRNLVTWEGFVIGVLSIFIAFGLSLLLSFYVGRFIGNMAFRTPLSLTLSTLAMAIWVLIIVTGSYIATFYPARRANRITTREALAYE